MTRAAHALDALGDPTRRSVFELLAAGPRSVADLAAQLPVSRPAVSQHLRTLHEAGLVTLTPDGRRNLYRVDPDGIDAVRTYFAQFWTAQLTAFGAAARTPPEEHP